MCPDAVSAEISTGAILPILTPVEGRNGRNSCSERVSAGGAENIGAVVRIGLRIHDDGIAERGTPDNLPVLVGNDDDTTGYLSLAQRGSALLPDLLAELRPTIP